MKEIVVVVRLVAVVYSYVLMYMYIYDWIIDECMCSIYIKTIESDARSGF